MVVSVADISKHEKIVFDPALVTDPTHVEFKYGWCKTDHKEGRQIRREYRKTDYMKDRPYAASIKKMLEKMGLPFPKDEEIFRGTHHDLLFLNSHGVVIRIGPLDVKDLMNPAIVQPLGWIEDRRHMIGSTPFTVAIYPGIELYNDLETKEKRPTYKASLAAFLGNTGQGTGDAYGNNTGYIRVFDEKNNEEVAVNLLLDADNKFNGSSSKTSNKRIKLMTSAERDADGFSEVMSKTLTGVFKAAKDFNWYLKAYEVHEPLRRLFWQSFKDKKKNEMPDAERLQLFWDTCARVTNNPASCVMPVWKMTGKGKQAKFVREEVFIPQVILYRPWTGYDIDKFIPPVGQAPEVLKALRTEFLKECAVNRIKRGEKAWVEYLEEELHRGENNWQILANRLRYEKEAREQRIREGRRLWIEHLEKELHLGEDNWEPLAGSLKSSGPDSDSRKSSSRSDPGRKRR
jgi:hypothetical protein